jgi:hypothetical protein
MKPTKKQTMDLTADELLAIEFALRTFLDVLKLSGSQVRTLKSAHKKMRQVIEGKGTK